MSKFGYFGRSKNFICLSILFSPRIKRNVFIAQLISIKPISLVINISQIILNYLIEFYCLPLPCTHPLTLIVHLV